MAGNAVIGALRVVLGADSAALEKGLTDASGKLSDFAGSIAKAGALAATAFAAAGVGIAMSIRHQIDEMDKLGKAAQSAGMGVEEFSKLKFAADLSDVSLEALGVSMGKLAKNMSAAAGGATGPATEAFKAMGVAVTNTDGTLRSSGDVLADISQKFKGYEDSASKTALAIALFGKAGALLIPLLNQGKEGLSEAADQAEKYGIVIGADTARAAESFNDNLKRMSAISQGIWTQITAEMLPAFLQLSKVFLENKENSTLMKGAAEGLIFAMRAAVSVAVGAATVFQRLGAEISALWKVLMAPDWESMKAAWQAFQAEATKSDAAFKAMGDTIAKFWKDADAGMQATGESAQKKMAAPIIEASNKAKDALTSFLDSTMKRTAGLAAEAQTIGQSKYATDQLRIALEAEQIAKNNNITVTSALKAKIDEVAASFATMAEKANYGKQVFEQTRTPLEQYRSAIEDLNGALQRGSINHDTYARGVAQAQQQFAQADPYARAFGQSLENAFGKAIDGGMKLKDVLSGLLKDLTKALANEAFRSLLYGTKGGSSGGLMGGLVGGVGKLFGFADGGSFQVGGSGGIDSQLVAFRASPDERVSVTKPGQSDGGAMTVHISLDNDMLRAVVVDESGRQIARATPQIVNAASKQTMRDMPRARAANPNLYAPA